MNTRARQTGNGTTQTRCCIAGGGPAGIMAGILLARAGVDTVVLEKHADFLRDFRGDTVHPSSMDVLAELGWLEDFLKRPHQELSRIRAHFGHDEVTIADFRRSPTRARFIAFMPQWHFLNFLVERARALPRFSLEMKADVIDLVEEAGRVVGIRAETPNGPLEVRSDLVIAADGRHSLLREKAGLVVHDVGAPIDVVWLRLPRHQGDPEQSLGWVRRRRFMALIDREDYWQIAFVIPKGGFDVWKTRGIAAFRADLAETAPFLADRVDQLRGFEDVSLLVVKVDRLEKWWRRGLLCIGDAAHAMSPVGGVGINLAIQDAVAAANILSGPLARGTLTDRDLARVQRRRELPTRATQALQVAIQSRLIQHVLSDDRPLEVGPILRLLNRAPPLQHFAARLVGVGVRPEHVATRAVPDSLA
jgi:2-polyprenyl-6-methoxyphenol hydroxylase-like FAD-dependent oxidoreductase